MRTRSASSPAVAGQVMAMSKLPWTPWHKVVKLREDVRTGEMSLAIFAADLYGTIGPRGCSTSETPEAAKWRPSPGTWRANSSRHLAEDVGEIDAGLLENSSVGQHARPPTAAAGPVPAILAEPCAVDRSSPAQIRS